MPVNNNAVNQDMQKQSTLKRVPTPRSFRKAAGTRLGTLEDWREGFARSGNGSQRHGQAIRDGR